VSAASFRSLARAAAASYPRRDRFARHFAYGKLTRDPVFAWLLAERLVPEGSRVLDLGCGQGLLAALLYASGVRLASYTGIDFSARDVERAQAMLGHWAPASAGVTGASAGATVGDIRTAGFAQADVVVLLDVLHYLDRDAQAAVLDRAAAALAPGATLLLRVADSSGSLRFRFTEMVDRLALRLRGRSLRRLWSRAAGEWRDELQGRGFHVVAVPMSAGTLFANVVLVARYDGLK
jgi:SAM-dependent methyltransferase